MVTPYFSYNWKTKEKSKIKWGKYWQFLVMSRMALTPSKASLPGPPGHAGMIPKKCSPAENTPYYPRCAHLLTFSPILRRCRKTNYRRQQTVRKPIQSTQMLSNNKYYILLTNSFMLTPYPDRFLCSYSFNVLLITKISQFAENNLLA